VHGVVLLYRSMFVACGMEQVLRSSMHPVFGAPPPELPALHPACMHYLSWIAGEPRVNKFACYT